jgi:hypothetical protein
MLKSLGAAQYRVLLTITPPPSRDGEEARARAAG